MGVWHSLGVFSASMWRHPAVLEPSDWSLTWSPNQFLAAPVWAYCEFFFLPFLFLVQGFVFFALWAHPVGLLLMVRASLQRTVVLDVSAFLTTASHVDIINI